MTEHSVTHPAVQPTQHASVVHLVGRVTDTVASFLGPATHALAESGALQTVIYVDDAVHASALLCLHSSVQLVPVPNPRGSLGQFRLLRGALQQSLGTSPVEAVHLHGLIPSVIGAFTLSSAPRSPKVYCSPHGSKLLSAFKALGGVVLWTAKPLSGRRPQRAIANIGADVRALQALTQQNVELIESPVAPVFFATVHGEAPAPRVVSGHHAHDDAASIASVAQMAVLLSGENQGAHFSWLGPVAPGLQAPLQAARVAVATSSTVEERALELGQAWLYYAPPGARGFPVRLAEAMTLGVPCVAFDTPYHRDLIRHGDTGLLCSNADEALTALSELMASQPMRQRIGAAAREEAQKRFHPTKFRTSFLAAYENA
ncbi:MAG: glycosyltransferase [Pseudomonadota bacterium]